MATEDIGEEGQVLMLRVAPKPFQPKLPEGIYTAVLSEATPERFDRSFVRHVLIAVVLFAAATTAVVYRVPVIGHPWSLLFGPLAGVFLTLRHRPAR